MVQIIPPAELLFREQSWEQTDTRINQQSEFTGRSRQLLLGPAARWTCAADIVTRTPQQILEVKAFLGAMALNGAFAVIGPGGSTSQQIGMIGATPIGAVKNAGQLGIELLVDGLTPSTVHLLRGHLINFGADDGAAQLCMLREPLISNTAGEAVAALSTPIRRSPIDNGLVHLAFPFAHMRLATPLRWQDRADQLHDVPSLQFVENF